MKAIDENKIKELCRTYTTLTDHEWQVRRDKADIDEALDAALVPLQALWRRRLNAIAKRPKHHVSNARVWFSVNHSHRPVTGTPIATAEVWVNHDIQIKLHCVASRDNIEMLAAKLKRILEICG